jgi:hypothetical protein
VGPRAGLDTEVRGKILLPLPGIEPRSPGRPVHNQTLYLLSYPTHCGMHFINFSIFQSLRSQQEVKITKRVTVPSVWHNRQIAGARTLAFEQTFTRVLASFSTKCMHFGRAMAQVVSRRPLTAEAQVRVEVNPCGICGGQSGTGTGFSPSSSAFPCQYIIPPSLSKLISSGECVIC